MRNTNIFKLLWSCLFILFSLSYTSAQVQNEPMNQARAAGRSGNYAKALELTIKAHNQDPKDMDIKEFLGKCYLELGQLNNARVTLLDVLRKSPERLDARYYLINVEARDRRYASAVGLVNEILERKPYDKELWMRKISFYKEMKNFPEMEKATIRLMQMYPNDAKVKELYNARVKDNAGKAIKKSDMLSAAAEYESALKISKNDPDIYLGLINAYINLNDYNAALTASNKGLTVLPNNEAIFLKKISVLEAQTNYSEAISLLEQRMARRNNPKYRQLISYLIAESAKKQVNTDPYILYSKLYARNPGDKQAYDYILKMALERGNYTDAQGLLTKGLKARPNSKDLLVKQALVYEETKQTEKSFGIYQRLNKLFPNDTDIYEKYVAYTFNDAKKSLADTDVKEALRGFQIASTHPEYRTDAKRKMFALYEMEKKYPEAIQVIDELIVENPRAELYLLQKMTLLSSMEAHDKALEEAKKFYQKFPNDARFPDLLEEFSVKFIKILNEQERYEEIIPVVDFLLQVDPRNKQAYSYGIGARVGLYKTEDALSFSKKAVQVYPEEKIFRLKNADLYTQLKDYEKASDVLKALKKDYPYNDTIRTAWLEAMYLDAKMQATNAAQARERQIYEEILLDRPAEIPASISLAKLHLTNKDYEEALRILDRGIGRNPLNDELVYYKGLAYEYLGDYPKAIAYQETYRPLDSRYQEHKEHIALLKSKLYKNQVSFGYTNVKSDSVAFNTSVANLEYAFSPNKNHSIVGRMNYAGRPSGVGIQGEVDYYLTLNNKSKTNFLFSAGLATKYFQQVKASVSYFQPLKGKWQTEIGMRYAKLTNDNNFMTGIVGLEKTFNTTWLNLRAFYMNDSKESYYNVLAQARFYMLNERDYIVGMMSVGNAPEDDRLDFQLQNFLSFTNTLVGTGYFHHLSYKSRIGVLGTWANYQMNTDSYINQYNVSVSFLTKF